MNRPTYRLSVFYFLRLLGLVYFVAIYSLWMQGHGLIGEQGILPLGPYLDAVREQLGAAGYLRAPTVFWLASGDTMLSAVCWVGMGSAALLFLGVLPLVQTVVLWVIYLSLTVAGQQFLAFQWDSLLLEAGLLAVLVAPPVRRSRRATDPDPPRYVVWLLHWLLFRLMFFSGYVKLASGDPVWRDLTALSYHFWTQPLPSWSSWYAAQWPAGLLKTGTAVMFAIELVGPFLILIGRHGKLAAFLMFTVLQAGIALTGNYGFFNLLAVVLCVPLLNDGQLGWLQTDRRTAAEPVPAMRWVLRVVRGSLAVVLVVVTTVTAVSVVVRDITWPVPVTRLLHTVAPLRSANTYGLFAVMTKTRPEIILEGSRDGENWQAYEFHWKPGAVGRTPEFIAPYMPRLDWQMWFAALGEYRQHPWLHNTMVRLLEGEPTVLALLETNPFPDAPPRFVRAVLYTYTFAPPDQHRNEGLWWNRTMQRLYCPVLRAVP